MPSHSETKTNQLKRYFARRVTNQVRLILGIWRLLYDEAWTQARVEDLIQSTKTLIRFAHRFDEDSHQRIAAAILELLEHLEPSDKAPDTDQLNKLNKQIQLLSQTALRKSDLNTSNPPPMNRKIST